MAAKTVAWYLKEAEKLRKFKNPDDYDFLEAQLKGKGWTIKSAEAFDKALEKLPENRKESQSPDYLATYNGFPVRLAWVPIVEAGYRLISDRRKTMGEQAFFASNNQKFVNVAQSFYNAVEDGEFGVHVPPVKTMTSLFSYGMSQPISGLRPDVYSFADLFGLSREKANTVLLAAYASVINTGKPLSTDAAFKLMSGGSSAPTVSKDDMKTTAAKTKATAPKTPAMNKPVIDQTPAPQDLMSGGMSMGMMIGLGVAGLALIYFLTSPPASAPKAA